MSTSCGFGRIKDLRVSSLCIAGKEIVDSKRNMNVNTIKNKNTLSQFINSSGSVCATRVKTPKICEKKENEQVVISKPIFLNQHGISKAVLVSNYEFDEYDFGIIEAIDFSTEFEGQGPSLILQNNHLFTVPSTVQYINSNLKNWKMIVEMNLHLVYQGIAIENSDAVFLRIEKNKTDFEDDSDDNVISLSLMNPGNEFFSLGTIEYNNIYKLEPNDTLDISIKTEISEGKLIIASTDETEVTASFVTFKILGFESN
jgi:hypothetical protein